MFLLEGIPVCLLGVACLWVLADTPKQATWLTVGEREALVTGLDAEKHERPKKDLLEPP